MSEKKILIVEDDVLLAEHLRRFLREQLKAKCEWVMTVDGAQEYLDEKGDFDLLILDRKLRDGEGLEVLRLAKINLEMTRVLILTGLGQPEEREKGLLAGANDYLVKPFTKGEFLARVNNLLHLHKINEKAEYFLTEEFVFKTEEKKLLYDQKEVRLTRTDSTLLEYFFQHRNFLVTWEEIERCLWSANQLEINKAAIVAEIYRLRKKMGRFGEKLQTFYKVGYQLIMTERPMQRMSMT